MREREREREKENDRRGGTPEEGTYREGDRQRERESG